MTKRFKNIPSFNNEAEEQKFWKDNDSVDFVDWSQAQRVTMPNLKPSTKLISLRIPEHLLNSIKVAANSRDVPYQSLIKIWLSEKVSEH